jgi:hypothetical protein
MFVFPILLLAWLGIAIAIGVWADSWGRSPVLFLLVSVIMSPFVATGLLLLWGDGSSSDGGSTTVGKAPRLRCPKCNTVNNPQARYCSGCGVQIAGPKTE